MDQKKLIIWDIRTGLEKRSFALEGPAIWPIFRWSKDDKYFARLGSDILSVYETPVSIKIHNVKVFCNMKSRQPE